MTVVERGGGARAGAGLSRWLALVAPRRARGQVTVAIAPDRVVRALNRRFRGKNRPTDVLSFPAIGAPRSTEARRSNPSAGEGDWLGDIVIARGMARAQAREGGHRLATEVRILALHGLLHLLGYDHETDDGRMARLEERLRRLGGVLAGRRG